jgi:hypothetical protein
MPGPGTAGAHYRDFHWQLDFITEAFITTVKNNGHSSP